MATFRNKSKTQSSSSNKSCNSSSIQVAILLFSFLFITFNYAAFKWIEASMESPRNKSKAAMADRSRNSKAIQGTTATSTNNLKKSPTSGSNRKLAQLSCAKYGGPSDAAASEMVYWEDIEIDAKFISPFKRKDTTQYLTFEPDLAGFNNVRMGVETVVALAHAMGKTLVVPPDRTIWAMDSAEKEQKNAFSFDEILHLDSIKIEHPGLNIISMEEFLSEVAIKEGKFKNPGETEALYPPNNKTKWDGEELLPLWEYLRTIGLVKEWNPDECVALFPSSRAEKDLRQVEQMFNDIIGEANGRPKPKVSNYDGKPLPVDSPAEERLREILGGREKACPYDKEMQDTTLLHFKEDWTRDIRFLTHFYGLLFFQDWKQDLWTKRFIRDHVHFNDEIVCAAARVVEAIRKRAKERHPETNPNGDFDTLHVRRNDWATQFPAYSVTSDVLFEVTESELIPGRTVFIATDERDKEYFRPLTNVYDVVYLDNFKEELGSLNTNFYVFVDQLVAARGRVFFGVYLSTFTGYINRLRGYYSVKEKRHGYRDGIIDSYHYAQLEDKNMYRKYHAFSIPPWSREYPIAWRDLDYGIEALYNSYSGEANVKS